MLLAIFEIDYGDEFSLYGFALVKEELWQEYLEHLKEEYEEDNYIEWYFGSNEFISWDSLQEIIDSYYIRRIDDVDVENLRDLFDFRDWQNFLGTLPLVRNCDEKNYI